MNELNKLKSIKEIVIEILGEKYYKKFIKKSEIFLKDHGNVLIAKSIAITDSLFNNKLLKKIVGEKNFDITIKTLMICFALACVEFAKETKEKKNEK